LISSGGRIIFRGGSPPWPPAGYGPVNNIMCRKFQLHEFNHHWLLFFCKHFCCQRGLEDQVPTLVGHNVQYSSRNYSFMEKEFWSDSDNIRCKRLFLEKSKDQQESLQYSRLRFIRYWITRTTALFGQKCQEQNKNIQQNISG